MIIGEYKQKIGDKNRIAFPKKFREELGNKLIVTKGYEGCLLVLSPAQWEEVVSGSVSGPFVSGLIRDTSRFLLGSATEIELDSQGRFVIPPYLIEYSAIDNEVVFLGLGRWVEVWSDKNWQEKKAEIEGNSSSIADKLAGLKLSD
jgi:MraZ protein